MKLVVASDNFMSAALVVFVIDHKATDQVEQAGLLKHSMDEGF